MSSKIVIIEDEPDLVRGLADALGFEGYQVQTATQGEKGVELVTSEQPDCVILDLMLPDINGYEVCRRIRDGGNTIPIIMLTARSQESDKIRGLEMGADDYITKPFSVGELVARVKAQLRRAGYGAREQMLQIGDCSVDLVGHTVERDGTKDTLTAHEAELLRVLHTAGGEALSREELLSRIWGEGSKSESRAVDNLVVKLRRKLESDQKQPQHIVTVYGVGYRLVP